MSSRVRGKETARARAAEMRAAQARAERRRRIMLAMGALGLVIVVVGTLVIVKLTGGGGGTTTAATKPNAVPASVMTKLTSVPTTAFDTVGATGVTTVPTSITSPPLTAGGKPRVLYVGA